MATALAPARALRRHRLARAREATAQPLAGSSRPAVEAGARLPPEQEPNLEALAAQWWTALDAAQSALRAGGRYLGTREFGERSRRLAQERGEAVEAVSRLARMTHAESVLPGWLATPGITARWLGLPNGVVACVFDLDGVLTTSAAVHAAAWAETLDSFLLQRAERGNRQFIPFDRRRDYEDHLAGRPRLGGVRSFLASRGIGLPEGNPGDEPGAETVWGLANRKNLALRQRLDREGVAAFAGSRCYLEAARIARLHPAVVSPSSNTATILERTGLAHLLEQRIDGNTMEAERLRGKPAPDTLVAACERLHVEPGESAAFETTPAGVTAARAAGFKFVVGVSRSDNGGALRASDADLVIDDLAELLVGAPAAAARP